jgi:hypothetical protein
MLAPTRGKLNEMAGAEDAERLKNLESPNACGVAAVSAAWETDGPMPVKRGMPNASSGAATKENVGDVEWRSCTAHAGAANALTPSAAVGAAGEIGRASCRERVYA